MALMAGCPAEDETKSRFPQIDVKQKRATLTPPALPPGTPSAPDPWWDAGYPELQWGDGGFLFPINVVDAGTFVSQLDPDAPMPNFSLVDKNPQSPDIGEYFSPRYFISRVSAWYFSHAT